MSLVSSLKPTVVTGETLNSPASPVQTAAGKDESSPLMGVAFPKSQIRSKTVVGERVQRSQKKKKACRRHSKKCSKQTPSRLDNFTRDFSSLLVPYLFYIAFEEFLFVFLLVVCCACKISIFFSREINVVVVSVVP